MDPAEARYVAQGAADEECAWFGHMVSLASGNRIQSTMSVNVDKQGAIKVAKNYASGSWTKHIDILYDLERDLIRKQKVKVSYCPSSEMVAAIFTKPLAEVLYERCQNSMGQRQ